MNRSLSVKRIAGICSLVIGLIIIVAFVPVWLWLSLLGVVLIWLGMILFGNRC